MRYRLTTDSLSPDAVRLDEWRRQEGEMRYRLTTDSSINPGTVRLDEWRRQEEMRYRLGIDSISTDAVRLDERRRG